MSPLPQVSIIIPTHNRADFVRGAIESALRQTDPDLEVIVVDDGSTDDTVAVARSCLSGGRVRYIYQANQGRSAARNHGAALARGEFLSFLDSDDRLLSSALEAHRRVWTQQPEPGITLGGFQYVDEAAGLLGERRPWEEGDLTLPGWVFNCYGAQGAYCLRRSWFERVGGFDGYCEIAEDWDLFLRLAYAGCRSLWVREPVLQYRQHASNSSHGLALHCRGSLRALDKLFRQPDLPAEIAALESRAKAWVYVVFSRRAYGSGQVEVAEEYLTTALRLDPELAGRRKVELLETLLAPEVGLPGAGDEVRARLLRHLPSDLHARPGDVRRARARVEMAQFFKEVRRGAQAEAFQHLRLGVKMDQRWLANRAVIAFCIKQALTGSRLKGIRRILPLAQR